MADFTNMLNTAGSIMYDELIMEELQYFRTVDESDFGSVVADINYFHELTNRKPEHRIFVSV